MNLLVSLTDAENAALAHIAVSPEEWVNNIAVDRARIAINEIVSIYTSRALELGIQIPTTKEAIVEDAYARNWIQTAAEKQAEAEALFNAE